MTEAPVLYGPDGTPFIAPAAERTEIENLKHVREVFPHAEYIQPFDCSKCGDRHYLLISSEEEAHMASLVVMSSGWRYDGEKWTCPSCMGTKHKDRTGEG
jgi:hypothetical protein